MTAPVDLTPRRKYGNIPTEVDNIRFASKAEASRYADLKFMQGQGVISRLKVQPRYPLMVNGLKIATYVADFEYWDNEADLLVVEDVKSKATRTQVYKLKAKLMWAIYGTKVTEVEG